MPRLVDGRLVLTGVEKQGLFLLAKVKVEQARANFSAVITEVGKACFAAHRAMEEGGVTDPDATRAGQELTRLLSGELFDACMEQFSTLAGVMEVLAQEATRDDEHVPAGQS